MAPTESLPPRKKWGRVVIASLAIVTGMIWAWTGVHGLSTGEAAGYAVFDFIMTAACLGYGLAFLRWRRKNSREIWSAIGIIILASGSDLKRAIQGIQGGDISFDGAISLALVGCCALLLLLLVRSRQSIGRQPDAK